MNDKPDFLDCWIAVATSLFGQALAGEPSLRVSESKPMPMGSFGFKAVIAGDEAGEFTVLLDSGLLSAPLFGDGADQKAGWAEVLKEAIEAATGELLAKSGKKCQVTSIVPVESIKTVSRSYELIGGDRAWMIQVEDKIGIRKTEVPTSPKVNKPPTSTSRLETSEVHRMTDKSASLPSGTLSPGLELLLDVELEASLRFGAREMTLGEILEIGPGDVVQLDRHVNDPVELIIGDKIVAHGEVVLVDGNFGLRITDVAEPQRRLESIRCLF